VRYTLNFRPGVQSYLRGIPLTRQGRIRLYSGINDAATISDAFRADSANRVGPGSPFLLWRCVFADAGRLRLLTLGLDDSAAAFGVLTVVWADCV
jgi:hypothetical protein